MSFKSFVSQTRRPFKIGTKILFTSYTGNRYTGIVTKDWHETNFSKTTVSLEGQKGNHDLPTTRIKRLNTTA